MKKIKIIISVIFSIFLLVPLVYTETTQNWPMWRYDINRTAASGHKLPEKLNLLWSRELHTPLPAFSRDPRMCADMSYEPAAAKNLIFLPSMVDDSVTAYDDQTGRIKWKYITEGPIRFAPAYRENNLYFGSDDGYLYCVEAATGKLNWKFRGNPHDHGDHRLLGNERLISRWPVRGAPIIHEGAVYFGSGTWAYEGVYFFGLDARSGKLKWVNKQISRIKDGFNDHGQHFDVGLPPLGYPAVIGGKLFITSGRAFPAMLDLSTGKLFPYTSYYGKFQAYPKGNWYVTGINDYFFTAGHSFGLNRDVLKGQPADWVTMEDYQKYTGYSDQEIKKLQRKKAFITKTENNRELIYTGLSDASSPLGYHSSSHVESEKYILENFPKINVDPANLGREVGTIRERILTKDTIYFSEVITPEKMERGRGGYTAHIEEYDRIVALDMNKPYWKITTFHGPNIDKKGKIIHFKYKFFKEKWSIKSPYKLHIKSGNYLYTGKRDKVASIRISANDKPSIAWQAEIKGMPYRMITANEKLFVITKEGSIYCFGIEKITPKHYSLKKEFRKPTDKWQAFVSTIKKGLQKPIKGYAVVYGWGTGQLAETIAQQTELTVFVIEPDTQKASEARADLISRGIYGRTIHIINQSPAQLKLPPYFVLLSAAEDISAFKGMNDSQIFDIILNIMRPYTGKAYLPLPSALHSKLLKYIKDKYASGHFAETKNNYTVIERPLPPDDSAIWTHESSNPANTFATRDPNAKPPFGVSWFAGSIDRFFSPAWDYSHSRNPVPLVRDGIMYIVVAEKLYAMDIYTGELLWNKDFPETEKTRRMHEDHRKYGRPLDRNIIATPDTLYLFSENLCYMIDLFTGKDKGLIKIPSKYAGNNIQWEEVRIIKGSLLASIGKYLICMRRDSGKISWSLQSKKDRIAFAAWDKKIYAVDYWTFESLRKRSVDPSGNVYGIDLYSGKIAWKNSLDTPSLPEKATAPPKVRGTSILSVKPLVAYNDINDMAIISINRGLISAFKGSTGKLAWNADITESGKKAYPYSLEAPIILKSRLITGRGGVLDIKTGKVLDQAYWGTGKMGPAFNKRGCGRVVANEFILTYRDGNAAIVDIKKNKKQALPHIRSGCTTGMLPVGGILTGLNTAHGCNCNWPLFMSFSLFHMPEADKFEPAGHAFFDLNNLTQPSETPQAGHNTKAYQVIGGKLEPGRGGLMLISEKNKTAYALLKSKKELVKAEFRLALRSVTKKPKANKRERNGYFVFGASNDPGSLISCGIDYFKGTISISGKNVKPISIKHENIKGKNYPLKVIVDIPKKNISLNLDGNEIKTKITGNMAPVKYYGYKVINTETVFIKLKVK